MPLPYTRNDDLSEYMRSSALLHEVDVATFFEEYRMLDAKDPEYEGHVLVVYLETNKVAVGILDWVVKLGIQIAIHELISQVVGSSM
jgi:hypothetical protein